MWLRRARRDAALAAKLTESQQSMRLLGIEYRGLQATHTMVEHDLVAANAKIADLTAQLEEARLENASMRVPARQRRRPPIDQAVIANARGYPPPAETPAKAP